MQVLKLSALLLCLATAACGGSSRATPTPPATTAAASDPSCPVAVAGTSVTVEDEPSGAALVFVTTGDVAEVRRRGATLARMHNDHHGAMGPLPDGAEQGGGHDAHAHHGAHTGASGHEPSGHADHGAGAHGAGAHAGHAGGMIGIHSKAIASDVEGGVKITFVANGDGVAKLQSELRMHAQHLATGTCAMGSSS
jgi:hypothetical protein